MKNAEYWKKRFELLEQSQHKMGASAYLDIEKQYRTAQKQIEGQIRAWYQRFADNNNISLSEANRMLNSSELKEFKWDVQDYIRYAEENALNGQWVKQLENASAKFHISRLESLKLQTQQSLEAMFGNQLDTIDSTMKDVFKTGYYRTAFEIQKGIGVGWDFSSLDDKHIAKVINKPWAADGKNFSQRVWGNRSKLVNELNQTLTQNIVLGQDPQKAIDAIAKKMNTSKNNAGRLVMTEEAFFSSEAQKDAFKELGVEEYEIVATLDSHTSEICQDMDGQHFPMSQWEVGSTAPPFHVYCRSTTAPYFEDDFGVIGERAAKDEQGKTYYVPADMTYKKWQQSFVDGGSKLGLQPVNPVVSAVPDKPLNKYGKEIKFDMPYKDMGDAGKTERRNKRIDTIKGFITDLSNEYDTALTAVHVGGADKAAGVVDLAGNMNLNSLTKDTALHEFAHSMTMTDRIKFGFADEKEKEFWKELKKIRKDYEASCAKNPLLSISAYSHDNVDEFFAEAFAQAKMKELGIELPHSYRSDFTYSDKVLDLVNKYFKKDLKPVMNGGIINVKNINGSSGIIRTKEQFEKATKKIERRISKYSSKSSKWSGHINVVDSLDDNAVGVKEWSCDISVLKNADDGVLWHEMLHSCSASYFDSTVYEAHKNIEEASVEYFKQQICSKLKIVCDDAYPEKVVVLKALNNKFKFGSDYEFAKKLFNVSLPERYQYLEDLVDDALRTAEASFEDYNEVIRFVEQLKG